MDDLLLIKYNLEYEKQVHYLVDCWKALNTLPKIQPVKPYLIQKVPAELDRAVTAYAFEVNSPDEAMAAAKYLCSVTPETAKCPEPALCFIELWIGTPKLPLTKTTIESLAPIIDETSD